MNKFPKTLLLSRSVPPAPSGSAVIIANLARQFGSEEMVIIGSYYPGAPPVEWKIDWPRLIYANAQPPWNWRGARWIRWGQWPLLLLRAFWTLVTDRCQVILAVFPDESFLLASYVLARLTGKPFYVYFHNTFSELRPGSRFARWLQPRVFARAQHVFVMSEGMREFYRVKYPDLSCTPLVHSFNEELPDPEEVALPPLSRPLQLALFGNVNASNREAAGRVALLANTTPDANLTILTGSPPSFLKSLGFNGDNISIETVSRDLLLGRLSNADVIVLPHGFYGAAPDEEVATIFPTRTIEALICQRPILAHMPGDCFLARFLRRHDCALIVDEPSVDAMRKGLERLRADGELRHRLVSNALVAARQFQAPLVATHLRKVIQGGTALVGAQQAVENG